MPLEGLAALGLAASILQVIDFSTKLLSSAREIQMNGSTIRNSDLELIATDLKHTNEELKQYLHARIDPSTQGTQDEQVRLKFLPAGSITHSSQSHLWI